MATAHTPGPWTHGTDFSATSMQAVVRAPDGLTLAKVGPRYTPRSRDATLEANARLMAAAPDLATGSDGDMQDLGHALELLDAGDMDGAKASINGTIGAIASRLKAAGVA